MNGDPRVIVTWGFVREVFCPFPRYAVQRAGAETRPCAGNYIIRRRLISLRLRRVEDAVFIGIAVFIEQISHGNDLITIFEQGGKDDL